MKEQSIDYFRERERAERQAAETAACDQARRAHRELADGYARMLEAAQPSDHASMPDRA